MNYTDYIQHFAKTLKEGRGLPLGKAKAPARPKTSPDAPRTLIFAPHPDDECIIGLLPLRLQREAGWRIGNVPVTHGSNPARQEERHDELLAACAFLGWDLLPSPPPTDTDPRPAFDADSVLRLLQETRPALLLFPHAADWNSRHITTHNLVMDALRRMPPDFQCDVVETEFWGAMDDPTLMVEATVEQLADLVTATSFHVKEVERNPYHLMLPAWMMDNVRRGAERISGQGRAAPDFTFATLYRHSVWRDGGLHRLEAALLSSTQSPAELFHGNHC